jgi:fumarylacetoacetase
MLDHTHSPDLTSWVSDANGHPDFPIQNLPLGIFSPTDAAPRPGIAIGDHILDLAAVTDLLPPAFATIARARTLNTLIGQGKPARAALRHAVSTLLAAGSPAEAKAAHILHRAADCTLHLPAQIGDYTDFYAGIHHANAVGKLFRPDQPLMPNYKHVPIAYHGRASSIRPSGEPFHRPNGQLKNPEDAAPHFGPSRRLDYELELGVWIGPGNAPGAPIPIADAADHIAGFCLLNDWSARDIQAWEYQPLGPFLAKNFATTISPWIITPEALAPFRAAQSPRPAGDPRPLPYLWDDADQTHGALNIQLDVLIVTQSMRAAGLAPHRLSRSNARDTYWTVAQMVAHHASGGCDLHPGDLFGTGTLSGAAPDALASLLELTQGGRTPITLPNGETRRFLEDGDEILLRGVAEAPCAARIGFGECRAVVFPAIPA